MEFPHKNTPPAFAARPGDIGKITKEVPKFTSTSRLLHEGRGYEYATLLDQETSDFAHLIGNNVNIDGDIFRCIAVNRYSHLPPWKRGEPIGILVKPAAD